MTVMHWRRRRHACSKTITRAVNAGGCGCTRKAVSATRCRRITSSSQRISRRCRDPRGRQDPPFPVGRRQDRRSHRQADEPRRRVSDGAPPNGRIRFQDQARLPRIPRDRHHRLSRGRRHAGPGLPRGSNAFRRRDQPGSVNSPTAFASSVRRAFRASGGSPWASTDTLKISGILEKAGKPRRGGRAIRRALQFLPGPRDVAGHASDAARCDRSYLDHRRVG